MQQIWNYQAQTQSSALLKQVFASRSCPCCVDRLLLRPNDESRTSDGRKFSQYMEVLVCGLCGWWFAFRDSWDSSCGAMPDKALRSVVASGAALSIFADFPERSQLRALEREVRQHIDRHGTSDMWPALEDASTAILKAFGYRACATARSKDGGIDIVVDHSSEGSVYAQIKHSRNKIGVRILRELIGTTYINGKSIALLVTSSSFTRGVTREQERAAQRGIFVELVDGGRFLSALNLTSRLCPPSISDVLAVASPQVQVFRGEVGL